MARIAPSASSNRVTVQQALLRVDCATSSSGVVRTTHL
jgi:hypothetical protein